MPLLDSPPIFKPFHYPWAYEAWHLQQKIHWLPEEIPLTDDVRDWRMKLTPSEIHLLTQIFRFFTQSDIEVQNCYQTHYSRIFKPTEVKMMLTAFSNMETIHVASYAHLLDTLGLPETEYSVFLEYEEMKNKYDYMHTFNVDSHYDIAKTLAAFGAFTEGVQLFASFAMLLNFPRFGKMLGMGQIITLSARDETLHTLSIIRLYKEFLSEYRSSIDLPKLKLELVEIANKIISMEDKFIDLAFSLGPIQGLTPKEVKDYIRYLADRRLLQLGIEPSFGVKKNPLPWMDEMLNSMEFASFFEQTPTEYSKATSQGSWEDAF